MMVSRVLRDQVKVEENNPKINLIDKATNTRIFIENNGGNLRIYDPATGTAKLRFTTIMTQIETKNGLPADSTGTKVYSPIVRVSGSHIKSLVLRVTIPNIPADAVVTVSIYNVTQGTTITSVTASGAPVLGAEATASTGFSDGDLIQILVDVTTASATQGATFNLDFAVVEANHEVN